MHILSDNHKRQYLLPKLNEKVQVSHERDNKIQYNYKQQLILRYYLVVPYSTSKIASISTGIFPGNTLTPIAEREAKPTSSPKISTSNCEPPFATLG